MTVKELEKLEFVNILIEDIPLLDALYILISNEVHDSGYLMYKIYGVVYGRNCEITYAKCLSNCSDVIDITPTSISCCSVLSIDSKEPNLFRMFVRGNNKIKVKFALSDFIFEIVKVEENE